MQNEYHFRTKIEIKNIRVRGGLSFSAKTKNGKITKLCVKSPTDKTVTINGVTYDLKKGENKIIR